MKQKPAANKPGKKSILTPEYDSAREYTVLLEKMDQSIRLMAEQHTYVVTRLDKIDARLDKLEAKLDRVEARLDKVEARLEKIEIKLNKIEDELKTAWSAVTDDSHRIKKLEMFVDTTK